ncbi:MAG: hypothetical protein J6I89_05160 [Oscillospiraceae bacterium]|nr:hypothetical protein [Oscillospiraceae bacterium]
MVKELYQIKVREIALNITNGEVDSVRKKNVTKSGCRVYDNGCIGIAGVLGEPTEATWTQAEKALASGVPYPYEPSSGLVRTRTLGQMPDEAELISRIEALLATLKAEFPGFVFSNKVKAIEETVSLKNDLGLCLEDVQCSVGIGIVVKEEASANVFDTFISWEGRTLDTEAALHIGRQILSAHMNVIPMPEGKLPSLMGSASISGMVGDYLDVQKLKKGASLLSGKECTQIFAESFNLSASMDAESNLPFFDAEGTTLPNDRLPLIQHGVLLRGIADKKNAAEYGAELTASAFGGYDDVPTLGAHPYGLPVLPTGTLDEVLNGQDAVFIATASGGDITPAGDFATPVQTAYLCHEGKLVGRLPELNFRGNIFDLLGKDYLGCSSDKPFDDSRLVAFYGTLEA